MDRHDEAVIEAARHTLDRLPLERLTVDVRGRRWTLEAACDHDRLLAAAEGMPVFPYGLLLWESSIVLAAILADRGAELAATTVLELGAGVGLAGMAAAAEGASVTQTDVSPEALAVCRRNAAFNGIAGIKQEFGDWTAWTAGPRYKWVLGADVLYEPELYADLAGVLEAALEPEGTALFTDPGRARSLEFISHLKAAGWSVVETTRIVDALPPKAAGHQVRITIWEVKRP